ncbi:ZIP family metal transporter [Arthrobacter halodurans]|uniref:ZIP family metal transporter n=1 Tax=Arthrobacter halodurans TaxID=516699 RepID=A0ABV4UJ24_9MICC
MPVWLQALSWGTFAGGALLVGAAVAWKYTIPRRAVSTVMAFGAGALISALSFELVADALETGGLWPTAAGFLAGAAAYVAANALLVRSGAHHRRRARRPPGRGSSGRFGGTGPGPVGGARPDAGRNALGVAPREASGEVRRDASGDARRKPADGAQQKASGGTAIAVGALLDGVPESIVLGLGLVGGASVNPAMLAAVIISNVPEGLASTDDMKRAGKPAAQVFGIWGGIAAISGLSALFGYLALRDAPGELVAVVTAVAAGGILSMLSDTMIPEAFEEQHMLTGLIAALGFLAAFVLHHGL